MKRVTLGNVIHWTKDAKWTLCGRLIPPLLDLNLDDANDWNAAKNSCVMCRANFEDDR